MNNQEIQNELLQVQKEIAELPAGYISKKTINGKTKQYLQWTENGKKKSKYIDDELAEELRVKIERRRELQKREKELTFMLPKPQNSTAEIKPGSRRSNELHLTAKGSVAYGEGTSVFPLVKCYITLPKAQGVSPIKHSSTQKPSISFEAMKWMAFHITTHLT